jgi:phytol kinase
VYFAISITALFTLLWRRPGPVDRVPVAVAAVMAMTWGDGLASIIGQTYGRRHHSIAGHQRSWEGTLTMGLATLLSVLATLVLLPGSALSPMSPKVSFGRAAVMALVAGVIAPAAEAVSPAGTDNLSVPLVTALALLPFAL